MSKRKTAVAVVASSAVILLLRSIQLSEPIQYEVKLT